MSKTIFKKAYKNRQPRAIVQPKNGQIGGNPENLEILLFIVEKAIRQLSPLKVDPFIHNIINHTKSFIYLVKHFTDIFDTS